MGVAAWAQSYGVGDNGHSIAENDGREEIPAAAA